MYVYTHTHIYIYIYAYIYIYIYIYIYVYNRKTGNLYLREQGWTRKGGRPWTIKAFSIPAFFFPLA